MKSQNHPVVYHCEPTDEMLADAVAFDASRTDRPVTASAQVKAVELLRPRLEDEIETQWHRCEAELEKTRAERDALLAACKSARAYHAHVFPEDCPKMVGKLIAAIALCEKEAK